jgi:hypothetical protein
MMGRTSESWLKFATDAVEEIFNLIKNIVVVGPTIIYMYRRVDC